MSIRILLADDHALVRDTVGTYLSDYGQGQVVAASDIEGVNSALQGGEFDILLTDLHLPGLGGTRGIRELVHRVAPMPVAVMTGSAPPNAARDVIDAGARGFFPKTLTARSLSAAIAHVVAGQIFMPYDAAAPIHHQVPDANALSTRETEVLNGLCKGKSNREIATDLGLKEVTIKLYVRTVCQKLGAKNRTQAALFGRDRLTA